MSDNREGQASRSRALQLVLIFALLALLPATQGALFGWLYLVVPVAVFFYLYKWEHGLSFVGAGLVLAAVVSVPLSVLDMMIISISLVPLGYTLAQASFQGNSPPFSGLKGSVALCSCWLLFVLAQIIFTGANPVTEFLVNLDRDIEEALAYYRQSATIAPETMALLEQSSQQMKVVLPKILPSLLASLALFITWITMITGNRLIRRFTRYQPWPSHITWVLPDRLVWLLILAAVMSMVPLGSFRLIGLNMLIVLSFVYIFQGFSILAFFLHKWKVPFLLRFFLYGMMLFQSFGTVLLLIAGVGEVWLDLRRLRKEPEQSDSDPQP